MASSPETDVEEDHGDVGQTLYPLQIVFNVQETGAHRDPWCPRRWPPIIRHEEGPRQSKAAKLSQNLFYLFILLSEHGQ